MKGSYLLLLELENDKTIQIGKTKKTSFNKGFYIYIGSALNGIEQRIQRHQRKQKKLHWHIDYLLQHTRIQEIYYKETNTNEECTIAQKIDEKLPSIPKFGCSDCNCKSHLHYGSKKEITEIINTLNMEKANH